MRAAALALACLVSAGHGRRVLPARQEESATSKAFAALLLANDPAGAYQSIGVLPRYSPDVNFRPRSSQPYLAAKDPNAPKRPLSGYFLYAADRRPALQAEGLKVGEISKVVGDEWGKLTKTKKKPYLDKAEKAKDEYQVALAKYKKSDEYAAFQQSNPEGESKKSSKEDKKLKKMLVNQPKRAKNAFMLFADEKRAEVMAEKPGAKVGEISKTLGEMWSAASAEVKEALNKQVEKNKVEYEKKMAAYRKTAEYKAYLEAKAAAA